MNSNIEFSITGDGKTVMVLQNSRPHILTKTDYHIIRHFKSMFESRFPEAYNALQTKLENSLDQDYWIVIHFIKCNWGNDDDVKDIDHEGNLNFEHVRCPLRGGLCIYEDLICHPTEKTTLTPREVEVAKLLAAGYLIEETANRLRISVKTVETHRDHIYQKTESKNKAELAIWVQQHSI